jgi:hypothetical protein
MKNPALFPTCFYAGYLHGLSTTLRMEAIYSSEMEADFKRTTRHYVPEDNHRCENLSTTIETPRARVSLQQNMSRLYHSLHNDG